jgi:exodeoxyribonuclease V alpha subunit
MTRLADLIPTSQLALEGSEQFLSELDLAFANFLRQKTSVTDSAAQTAHLWLAALTSYQWSRGHACLDLNQLSQDPEFTLGVNHAIPNQLEQHAATLPWIHGEASPLVLSQNQQLYLRRAWNAEQQIRHSIHQRLNQPPTTDDQLQDRLNTLFNYQPVEQDLQRRACEVAATQNIALITGGPGTGKTTTVVKLLALLLAQSQQPLRISLAAPTGKAAARLSESIQKALSHMPEKVRALIPTQAQTLHRLLLQAQPEIASDVVIIDEASMVDLEMMARIMSAVPLQARLIFLGDKDQLASVEAGAVMAQLSTGELLKNQTVTLLQSHRFDAHSGIGQWAQAVNADDNTATIKALWQQLPEGLSHPELLVTQVNYTQTSAHTSFAKDLQTGWQHWLNLLTPHLAHQPCQDQQAQALLKHFNDFCVLCALREGPYGVNHLNGQIQRALGLGDDQTTWYVGRPVMVTRNDYGLGLMNGDIGLCLPNPQGHLQVAFEQQGDIRWISPARLDQVETVFAMTVHKSQGSEFEHVLLVIPSQDSPILTRELVYTGLTRAKQRLSLWAPHLSTLLKACAKRVLRSGGLQLNQQNMIL